MAKKYKLQNQTDLFSEENRTLYPYDQENNNFWNQQIITYIGNKRKLLSFLGQGIKHIRNRLNQQQLSILDGFAGSGIVSRYLKRFSKILLINDLELYSFIINKCYLSNRNDRDINYIWEWIRYLNQNKLRKDYDKGIIETNYAPNDEKNIKKDERVFYTRQNARIIDNIRRMILETKKGQEHFFLAPLLVKASIHVNTSGVFKGFYKNKNTKTGQFGGKANNCLQRIKRPICLPIPIFSYYDCLLQFFCQDINTLVEELDEVDVAYFDPPYNEHPYGSNYFMLNVIASYQLSSPLSSVSGIPQDWNHSSYNKKNTAKEALSQLLERTKAKFIMLSYNNEGLISLEEMKEIVKKFKVVVEKSQNYTVFRGSHNIQNRSKNTQEILYIIEK